MEITHPISLKPFQIELLKMHSVLAVLNAVQYDLLRLSDYLENPDELEKASNSLFYFSEDLNDPAKAFGRLESINQFCDQILAACESALAKKGKSEDTHGQEVITNLSNIFTILKLRAQELCNRKENGEAWQEFPIAELENNFLHSFNAIEENDHGAYNLVNKLAQNFKAESQVNFKLSSENNSILLLPPVFLDVLRDLLINARKYTAANGLISASIHQNNKEISIVVEDSGLGIPNDELNEVVGFGYRAANTKSRPTRGGGFGLSKAYYVTKSFGGRFFIDSPVPGQSHGTKISISLPLPTN